MKHERYIGELGLFDAVAIYQCIIDLANMGLNTKQISDTVAETIQNTIDVDRLENKLDSILEKLDMGLKYYNVNGLNSDLPSDINNHVLNGNNNKHNNNVSEDESELYSTNSVIAEAHKVELEDTLYNNQYSEQESMMTRSEKIRQQRMGVNNIPVSDGTSPISALNEAITLFAIGMNFHHDASLSSHMIGLQGFKRAHEYYSRMDEDYLNELQSYCIDIFGEKVEPDWSQVHTNNNINDTKAMLDAWYEHETVKYDKLNDVVTQLCNAGYAHEADLITCALHGVTREITKCRRHMQDFAKADWGWHHIRVIDMRLHDKYKAKEEGCLKHYLKKH